MAALHIADGIVATIDEIDLDEVHTVGFSCGLIWQGRIPSLTWRPVRKKHTTYVCCSLHGSLELRLHRVVMNASAEQLIDHVDHNGLNNCRSNLRIATHELNAVNKLKSKTAATSSEFKGVSFHKQAGKWAAHYRAKNVKQHIGLFDTEVEAALAYNEAARQVWGEAASLNVI